MCEQRRLLYLGGIESNHYILKTIFKHKSHPSSTLPQPPHYQRRHFLSLFFFCILLHLECLYIWATCLVMHVAIRVKLPFSRTETMNYSVRAWVVAILVCLVASNVFICHVNAAGECGKTAIPSAAASLSPCLSAAGNARAAVPPSCCSKVGSLIKTAPKCLCAVLLSPLAKKAGIKPGIAITIPKRCNIRNRPAGKKCGSYTLP